MSDLERKLRDEQQAQADLYPPPRNVVLHPGSSFGPHPFVPFADSERHVSCVKCGRSANSPIHTMGAAA